jgi:hypothetical protein
LSLPTLSAAIVRRAHELTKARLTQLDNASNGTSQPPRAPEQTPDAPATTPALPEAPASVNCHITIEGTQVQVTLRDTDAARLLARLGALLRQDASAQPPMQPPTQGKPQRADDESPYCHRHKMAMKRFSKDGRSWCSHKTADGRWCKGQ